MEDSAKSAQQKRDVPVYLTVSYIRNKILGRHDNVPDIRADTSRSELFAALGVASRRLGVVQAELNAANDDVNYYHRHLELEKNGHTREYACVAGCAIRTMHGLEVRKLKEIAYARQQAVLLREELDALIKEKERSATPPAPVAESDGSGGIDR